MKKSYHQLYNLLFHQGEVVEMRALGLSGQNQSWGGRERVASGYFNSAECFANAAADLEQAKPKGIYYTANPCDPALIARASNRLVAADKSHPLTSNSNIKCIRWLPVDIDPVRPAGISSSDSELAAAKAVSQKVVEFLEDELGFATGVRAMSGNGYHLLYRLPDLPNRSEIVGAKGLIARALAAIEARCGSPQAAIDQKVFNAGRIWKVYGTVARKGDDTKDRPHRQAQLLDNTPTTLEDVGITDLGTLTRLAEMAPQNKLYLSSSEVNHSSENFIQGQEGQYDNESSSGNANIDIQAYLIHYGIKPRSVKLHGLATFNCLEECIFDSSHRGGDAAIVVSPNFPYLTYYCFHNSCRDRTWKEARQLISGNDSLASFCKFPSKPRQEYLGKPNQTPINHLGFGDGSQGPGGSPLLAHCVAEKGIEILEGDISQVTHPHKINPCDFFTTSGKRMSYKPDFMANYLQCYCGPVRHTAGIFSRYRIGVWRQISRHEIEKVIVAALKEHVQPSWLKGALQILAAKVNQEEELWVSPFELINVKNGMISVKDMSLLPHDPHYWSRAQFPVNYDATADCPILKKALKQIFPEPNGIGEAKIRLLQEFIGYILLQTCRFEKALFMYGTGANGKSTILYVVEMLVGKENISALSLDDMSHRFSVPYLQNKKVNIASEVDTREKAGTETLKKAISGDILEGEHKHGEKVTFRSFVKFMFAMNTPPTITDKAYGFSRKVIVLNFNRRFQEKEMDRCLSQKLAEELSGIFNWALDGARRLLDQDGFTIDTAVKIDTEAFMASMNPFLIFLKEACLLSKNMHIPKKELFQHYRDWCAETLYKPMAMGKFYDQVFTNCPEVKETRLHIGGAKPHCYQGICKRIDWVFSTNSKEELL